MYPSLRFKKNQIDKIANEYEVSLREKGVIGLKRGVRRRGYLTTQDLQLVAKWKAARIAGHANKNSDEYLKEITRFAFSTKCERARIESLTLLDGVGWPMASAILHLFHKDKYPILDFRAIWSVSLKTPSQYNFDFWWTYVKFCRKVSETAGINMRTLDRALWQYSKEHQTTA